MTLVGGASRLPCPHLPTVPPAAAPGSPPLAAPDYRREQRVRAHMQQFQQHRHQQRRYLAGRPPPGGSTASPGIAGRLATRWPRPGLTAEPAELCVHPGAPAEPGSNIDRLRLAEAATPATLQHVRRAPRQRERRPGINDNASGWPTILETALTLAEQNPTMNEPCPVRLVDRRGTGPQRARVLRPRPPRPSAGDQGLLQLRHGVVDQRWLLHQLHRSTTNAGSCKRLLHLHRRTDRGERGSAPAGPMTPRSTAPASRPAVSPPGPVRPSPPSQAAKWGGPTGGLRPALLTGPATPSRATSALHVA